MITSNPIICVHLETHVTEVDNPDPLNCGACECPIAGNIYHCAACNSDLHPFCKSCPQHLSCPLHPHPLSLLAYPLASSQRRCDVCDEDIKGVSYGCSPCEFDLHPECSRLPLRVPCLAATTGNRHILQLQVGYDFHSGAYCSLCGDQCGRWAYRCDVCTDVSVHYWCLSMRLVDSPEAAPVDCQSRGLFRRRHGNNNNNTNNYNNNNYYNDGSGSSGGRTGGGFGRFMGRMTGSVAVSFISDVFGNMIDDGDFFFG